MGGGERMNRNIGNGIGTSVGSSTGTGIGKGAMLAATLLGAGLVGTLGGAAPALAQQPTVPAPPTREEISPQGSASRPEAPTPSRLKVEDEIERAPCALAEPAYADVKVNFASAAFRNLQGVSADELASTWAEFAGHEVPVAALCEIRDRAATLLRKRGYVAAVQVPPQRIEAGGTVQFDVLLAKLVGIRVRGKVGPSEHLIAAQLQTLVDQPYFNSNEAERTLLLAGDLPGYDIRLILRPAGGASGEVIGDVEVTRRAVEVSIAAQNYGSREIGRIGGLAQLRLNDLLGLGDSTRFSIFNTSDTREQTVLQFGEELALGTNGLRFDGSFVYAWTRPDVANRAFSAETLTATAAVSYPFVRKRQLTVRGSGGLDWVDQSLDFGAVRLSDDKLRVLFLRAQLEAIDPQSIAGVLGYTAQEPRWAVSGGIELRQGIDGLGASPKCTAAPVACTAPNVPTSRLDADPAGTLVRTEAVIDYRPTPDWTLSAASRAQVSSGPLLGFEQFSAGNYTIGRGFDPGIIQGDNGVGVSLELRYGRLMPASSDAFAFQPYVFFDSAWTWTKGVTSGPRRYDLQSAGGGVRAQWGGHGLADLTVAVPFDRAGLQARRGDVRVLFSISMQLFPW